MVRLEAVMEDYIAEYPSLKPLHNIVRLLMLTGCRKTEIIKLRWDEVKADRLNLTESKTGARVVWLNEQAAAIIAAQSRDEDDYVFPSPRQPNQSRPNTALEVMFWYPVRKLAGIEDVRIHDLRHTFASHAVMRGIPLPMVSRLLGHANISMTMRYAHVSDVEVEKAADKIGT